MPSARPRDGVGEQKESRVGERKGKKCSDPPLSGATEAAMPSARPRDGVGEQKENGVGGRKGKECSEPTSSGATGRKSLWVLALLLAVLIGGGVPWVLAQAPAGAVGVYYVGPDDEVLASLQEAAPYLALVDRLELAQVIVLNNSPLARPTLQEIGRQVLNEDQIGRAHV